MNKIKKDERYTRAQLVKAFAYADLEKVQFLLRESLSGPIMVDSFIASASLVLVRNIWKSYFKLHEKKITNCELKIENFGIDKHDK